jgi:hypothetical protein
MNLAAACAVSNPPRKEQCGHVIKCHEMVLVVLCFKFQFLSIGQELTQVHLLPTVPANETKRDTERDEHEIEQEMEIACTSRKHQQRTKLRPAL